MRAFYFTKETKDLINILIIAFFVQNDDGKLTMEEFREGSKCDPWIVQALAIDLPEAELTGEQKEPVT